MLTEAAVALSIAAAASALILGLERKIQARIQRRRGPSLLMPGVWTILKSAYKRPLRPDSPSPGLYGMFLLAGIFSLAAILVVTLPGWHGILGFASLLGLAGLLKVEEATYLFMGSFSRSIMSTGMPFPDTIRGSEEAGIRSYFEDVAAVRALKMITFGSFPFYIALTIPFMKAGSMEVGSVLSTHPPALAAVSGMIGAAVYFLGYNMLANNRPFDIVKPKVDIMEGPLMEYIAGWRALAHAMRGLSLFVLSSVFVTLYLAVPFDVAKPGTAALHLALAVAMPAFAAVLKAYSPVLTFKQIYPVSHALTVLGTVAVALAYLGV